MIAKHRNSKGGGGVGFLCGGGLSYKTFDTPFEEGIFETLGVQVQINKKRVDFVRNLEKMRKASIQSKTFCV